MNNDTAWRIATAADLDAIMAIQDEVHAALLPERPEIFADKMHHFGEGCLVLQGPAGCIGYGVAHPWRLGRVPPLDTLFGSLPAGADCLFVHDVALLLAARGQGAGKAFIDLMHAVARRHSLGAMALVSVYGTVPVWAKLGFALDMEQVPAEKLASYGPTARYMVASVGAAERQP